MVSFRSAATSPILIPLLVVGMLLFPLLVGIEPVGGDADLMYRPIKKELARSLREGRIPYWSDHFGIGMPLVAESHVAAFYPPNWLFYRLFEVATAYRLSMWLHFMALAAATYAYARVVGTSQSGSALAALSFSLCGFQAVHAVHEPFCTLMPYVPLCLLLGDRYAATGRLAWLAALALAWGVQIMVGHFQIQAWTAGLVLLTGGWRIAIDHLPRWRWLGLAAALAWGAAVACVQLKLTWELTQVVGLNKPAHFLANYSFPITHWGQWALPALYLGRLTSGSQQYWANLGTTADEACAYVGVVALALACVGFMATGNGRSLAPWRWIALLAFALATLPQWWPGGFLSLVKIPGFGWFRAPARYTLLTSLALALLAGRGLDRSIPRGRFWGGLGLALGIGVASFIWSAVLSQNQAFRSSLGDNTLGLRFAAAMIAWVLGLGAIIAWRQEWLRWWGPLSVAAVELCALFYLGAVEWGWTVHLPQESAVLERLAAEPGVGIVAGRLGNLPVWAGRSSAYPSLGIPAPSPNYLLRPSSVPPGKANPFELRWQRRLGVTHGIWTRDDDIRGTEVVAEVADPLLYRLVRTSFKLERQTGWKLVRYPNPFPSAWVAVRGRETPGWGLLYSVLSRLDVIDEAWFLESESPRKSHSSGMEWELEFQRRLEAPRVTEIDLGPPARLADVKNWDGRTAIVDHDGSCYLIVRRTYYPGWTYRVNDGPEQLVLKVNGGLQCAALTGTGTSRVTFQYRPTGLRPALVLSAGAAAAALICLFVGMTGKRIRARSRPAASKMIG